MYILRYFLRNGEIYAINIITMIISMCKLSTAFLIQLYYAQVCLYLHVYSEQSHYSFSNIL